MSLSRAEKIVKTANKLATAYRQPLVIVETGTIRNVAENYHVGDGHSTLYLARWLAHPRNAPRQHKFFSIDLHTGVCNDYLTSLGLREAVTLIEGNSLDVLANWPHGRVDMFYLDSANSAQNTLDEFKLAEKLAKQRTIFIIDDVDLSSQELQKGKLVIPYAKENKYRVDMDGRLAFLTKVKR